MPKIICDHLKCCLPMCLSAHVACETFPFFVWCFGALALLFCVGLLALGFWLWFFYGGGVCLLALGCWRLALGVGLWAFGFWYWAFHVGMSAFGCLALVFWRWYFCVAFLSLAIGVSRLAAALGFRVGLLAGVGLWGFGVGLFGQRGRSQRGYWFMCMLCSFSHNQQMIEQM